MKRAMLSIEEFEQRVELEVKKRFAAERDDTYEKGRSEGWQEGYDEGYRDAEYDRDVDRW